MTEINKEHFKITIDNLDIFQVKNPYFIGRQDILDNIRIKFFKESKNKLVLQGIDGIGKTSIAIEHVFNAIKNGEYGELVFTLNAGNTVFFEEDLDDLASKLWVNKNPNKVPSPAEKKEYLFQWLRNNEHWFILLDDVKDIQLISDFLKLFSGHILITSANPDWDDWVSEDLVIDVPPLKEEKAIEYLAKVSNGGINEEEALFIIKKVERIPILLELVGNLKKKERKEFFHHSKNNKTLDLKKISISQLMEGLFPPIISEIYKDIVPDNWITRNLPFTRLIFVFTNRMRLAFAIQGVLLILVFFDSAKKIPSRIFIDLLENSAFYSRYTGKNLVKKAFYKYFNSRYYQKIIQFQNELLQLLRKRSIIHLVDKEDIMINPTVQKMMFPLISKTYNIQIFGVKTMEVFVEDMYFLFRWEKDLIKKKALLPHMMALILKMEEHQLSLKHSVQLSNHISSFLQDQFRFKSANIFAKYSFELEKKFEKNLKGGTVENLMSTSILSFSTTAISDFVTKLEDEEQFLVHQKVASGLRWVLEGDFLKAYKYFDEARVAVESDELEFEQKGVLYLLLSLSASSSEPEESEIYLEEGSDLIQIDHQNFNEKLGFLFIKWAILSNLTTSAPLTEEEKTNNYEKAADFLKDLLDEMEAEGNKENEILILKIDGAFLAYINNDGFLFEELAEELKQNEQIIFSLFEENTFLLGEYCFIQGAYAFMEEEFKLGKEYFQKAKSFYKKIFNGLTQRIDLINELIAYYKKEYPAADL